MSEFFKKITPVSLRYALFETPLLWLFLGVLLNFYIPSLNKNLLEWNIVEISIAQNILEGQGYVLDPLSPPAIWRPPLIPLLTLPMLLVTNNPVKIFTILYLLSIASLAAFLFYSAKLISGRLGAHIASFLAISTPAIGSVLALHIHGFSHIGFMIFVGPSIYFAIRVFRSQEKLSAITCGFLLGLLYLSRPECIFLFCITLFFFLVSASKILSRQTLYLCSLLIIPFLIVVIPYEKFKSTAIKDYQLFPSGLVASFYNSEGWG